MKKILVLQTWGIGDMVMTTPMLSALRNRLPNASITVVAGTQAAADVIEGSPLCDDVKIISPAKMGYFSLIRSLYRLRAEDYDAALICTRISPRLGQLLRVFSGIRVIAGDSFDGKRWGYTHWTPIIADDHRVTANMKIVRTLFPDAQEGSTYFHLDSKSAAEAGRLWTQWGLDGQDVLGVHLGSDIQGRVKRIPPEKFLGVAKGVLEKLPRMRILVFFGPDDEDIMPKVPKLNERVLFASRLSLRVTAGLIAKTRVMWGADSGLMHIASIFGIPLVICVGPTHVTPETSTTKPWRARYTAIRTDQNLACMPCYGTPNYMRCPYDVKCMHQIDEGKILKVLLSYL